MFGSALYQRSRRDDRGSAFKTYDRCIKASLVCSQSTAQQTFISDLFILSLSPYTLSTVFQKETGLNPKHKMRLSSLFTLASALGALAAPASQKDAKVHDIILPAGANVNAVLAAISKGPADVTAVYNNSAFSGFSGVFTREEAKILKKLTDVKEVAEEVIITAKATRNNTPWGLQRVSQSPTITTTASDTSNSFNYQYDSTALGSGVNIYIIDTGINTQHGKHPNPLPNLEFAV